MSRISCGMVTMSKPLLSPVKFINSSSTAASGPGKASLLGVDNRVEQFLRLQQRTDVAVEGGCVNAFAAISPCELAVRVPRVRHRTADGDHLLKCFDLAVHCVAVSRDEAGSGRVQRGEEFVAVTCDQIHRVGAEKLVVADGGRNRLRVLVRREPRLRVVFAVASGLEGVDANRCSRVRPAWVATFA